ncbi:MAG: hypothetical protein EOM24_00980 [Chloroflexia bacterium]|nr:hypothetical protein [Chloroflexia bacterium]
MSNIAVQLFGRLHVRYDNIEVTGLEVRKVQELLCYLLIHRQRPHAREGLASILWSNTSTAQSRANLRRTLWQLQHLPAEPIAAELLAIEADWIQIKPHFPLWLDVAEIEAVFEQTKGQPGEELSHASASAAAQAVDLYRGDLFDGCYQDWCLVERERLQQMYLALLDKLMGYCEYHGEYERGLAYGAAFQQYDNVNEQCYRRMMRLYWRAGDRSGALRQYERCAAMLAEEFETTPGPLMQALVERLKTNQPIDELARATDHAHAGEEISLSELALHLRQLQMSVDRHGQVVRQALHMVEQALRRGRSS